MTGSTNRRTRPWRKLAVVVEVTVPPTNRSLEKHLAAQVRDWLPDHLCLPVSLVANHHKAAVRVKAFKPYYRAAKIAERKARAAGTT